MAEQHGIIPARAASIVLVAMTVVIVCFVNLQIVGKERILRDGTTVLLRLAPVDPRSLLQGDYMALRYAIADEVARAARNAGISDGRVVVRLDESSEAHLVGIHDGKPLAQGQHLLRFRQRGDAVRLASDAYFFEEGRAERYAGARFGELKVDDGGDAVLVGLRDEAGHRLAD